MLLRFPYRRSPSGVRIILSIALIGVLALSISSGSIATIANAQYGISGPSIVNVDIVKDAATKASNAFSPNPVRAKVGDMVTWTNTDTSLHTVTQGDATKGAITGGFDSKILAPNKTYSYTFAKGGDFAYYCQLHPTMVGTVVVTAPGNTSSNISVVTNKSSYDLGESVSIAGKITNSDLQKYVTLTVTNPNGSIFKVGQFHPNPDGTFLYTFALAGTNTATGQWIVTADYEAAQASTSFVVQETNTTLPLVVNYVRLTDISGKALSNPTPGSQAVLSVSVSNLRPLQQSQFIILQVEDNTGTTDLLSWQESSIGPNQSMNAGFAWTVGSARSYKVEVFVWQAIDKPIPLADIYTLNLVIGSEQIPSVSTITIPSGASVQGSQPFDPQNMTVKKGDVVTVSNTDTVPHTVTSGTGSDDLSSGKSFDTSIIEAGSRAEIKTSNLSAGNYPFYCLIHPYMKGNLVVRGTDSQASSQDRYVAEISTSQGSFKIELYRSEAPTTVDNFMKLANAKFYDGIVFHRLVPGFVIQGGDPQTKDANSDKSLWGTGGPGYTIPDEFNNISHGRGIVSMAKISTPNSGGSQFFIVLQDSNQIKAALDGKYSAFGKVIDGIDIVDKIAGLQTIGGQGIDKEQPMHPDDARIASIRIVSN